MEEEGEKNKEKVAQKWNASVKIDEQQQPSLRPTMKASPWSSSKLMNHILRNKHNVSSSSSIAQRKDESIQTTTGTTRNNINNNNKNRRRNHKKKLTPYEPSAAELKQVWKQREITGMDDSLDEMNQLLNKFTAEDEDLLSSPEVSPVRNNNKTK